MPQDAATINNFSSLKMTLVQVRAMVFARRIGARSKAGFVYCEAFAGRRPTQESGDAGKGPASRANQRHDSIDSSIAVAQVLLHPLAHPGRRARHADLQRVGIGHRIGDVDLARQAALQGLVARDLEREQAALD
jgi:hypothetical protein